ncbi:MAG: hypothetical protein HC845_02255 [Akkermansiaceae bacterium]|nr:hypothetical protein [Akkermansiaceae bacterium]
MDAEKRKTPDLKGDTANLSIGQGSLLASPLQVAQAMAGIANGGALPKLQLVRQTQDPRGRVVQAAVPERKNWLGVDAENIKIVHKGMRDVVTGGGGTGKSAGLSFTSICGKTGTAQWGPKAKNQRLAWFAGFLPYDNPRYAFAVLYEGAPGEGVSGGRMAAPMVRRFFNEIKGDIKDAIEPPKKALVVDEDEEGETQSDEPKKKKKKKRGAAVEDVPELPEGATSEDIVPMRALPVDESEETTDEDSTKPERSEREGNDRPADRASDTEDATSPDENLPQEPENEMPGEPGEEP